MDVAGSEKAWKELSKKLLFLRIPHVTPTGRTALSPVVKILSPFGLTIFKKIDISSNMTPEQPETKTQTLENFVSLLKVFWISSDKKRRSYRFSAVKIRTLPMES